MLSFETTVKERWKKLSPEDKLRVFREVQTERDDVAAAGEFKTPREQLAFMNAALDRKLRERGL